MTKRVKGLVLTLGAVVVLSAMLFLITAVPALIRDLGVGHDGRVVVNILRWPALAIVMIVGLGVLYRVAVEQPPRVRFGIVTPGTVVATLVWLVASGGFAFYTANFARYSRTYGSLASIVVVLLWLYLSAFAVLIGAEVDGVHRTDAASALARGPGARGEAAGLDVDEHPVDEPGVETLGEVGTHPPARASPAAACGAAAASRRACRRARRCRSRSRC